MPVLRINKIKEICEKHALNSRKSSENKRKIRNYQSESQGLENPMLVLPRERERISEIGRNGKR